MLSDLDHGADRRFEFVRLELAGLEVMRPLDIRKAHAGRHSGKLVAEGGGAAGMDAAERVENDAVLGIAPGMTLEENDGASERTAGSAESTECPENLELEFGSLGVHAHGV